mgnify:CR=1 FL=1
MPCRLTLAAFAVLAIVLPAAAQPQQGNYEGDQAELHEDRETGIWTLTLKRENAPTLVLRTVERQAELVIGEQRMAITYEPLALLPAEGAVASDGPADPARGCTTTIFSAPENTVAHCRAEDGRLVWAAVLEGSAWRFVWIETP